MYVDSGGGVGGQRAESFFVLALGFITESRIQVSRFFEGFEVFQGLGLRVLYGVCVLWFRASVFRFRVSQFWGCCLLIRTLKNFNNEKKKR